MTGKHGGKVPTGVLPAHPIPPRGGSTPRTCPTCICPRHGLDGLCPTHGCMGCVDEAAGWYRRPHTCEGAW